MLFEKALALDPKDIAALVYRGEIRLGAGRLREALEDLRRATALAAASDPFVARARRLIGLAQDRLRRQRR